VLLERFGDYWIGGCMVDSCNADIRLLAVMKKTRQMIETEKLLNSEMLNLLIGGHYNFPNLPTKFAINSLKKCNDIVKQVDNSKLIAFINDIGFSNFCNHGVCDIPTISYNPEKYNVIHKMSIDDLIELGIEEMKSLDKKLCVLVPKGFINNIENYKPEYSLLKQYLLTVKQELFIESIDNIGVSLSSIYYLYLAIEDVNSSDKVFSWVTDYFVYYNNKNSFYPSSFRKISPSIDIFLEKSIYNYSSKIIRRLNKKGELSSLELIENEGNIEYQCKDFERQNITLRTENSIGGFNASNKCPLLIATFYYQLFRDYSKNNKNIRLIYMIPSYDRVRVNKGTEVFFNLYLPYLKKTFEIETTEIKNVYWISDNCKTFIMDTYNLNYHTTEILN